MFALAGLTALLVVGVASMYFAREMARAESLTQARQLTSTVAGGIVEPALSDELVQGNAAAFAAFDRVIRGLVLGKPATRVKLWTADGRVVYSDEERLVGQVFVLDDHQRGAFERLDTQASISSLDHPENTFEEHSSSSLLEVYRPVMTPGGTPLLLEIYLPISEVDSGAGRILWRFLPPLIAGLLLLELVHLPLAWTLARRVQAGKRDQEQLLRHALDSSDAERRRIAADLHDGPVQQLAGQSMTLAALAQRRERAGDREAAAQLLEAAANGRQLVRQLRSLLVDLHAPALHSSGLAAAVDDLATPLRSAGLTVTVDASGLVHPLPLARETLAFRACRELLANVAKHARASVVVVRLASSHELLQIVVEDDGVGFTESDRELQRQRGHIGLELLSGLLRNSDGVLEIDSSESGTRVLVEVPIA